MNARDRDASTEARQAIDAEGPLRRWARRRRDVAREEQAAETQARGRDAPDGALDARGSPDEASEPAVVEEKVLTDEDMPSLDSLDEDSDYSGFLSPGVTEELRRRALRKLFTSAVFNVPDGLDDYADDFTSFAALGDIVTSDMRHQAEVEAERAKQAQAETEPAAGLPDETAPADVERPAHADGEAPGAAEDAPAGSVESAEPPTTTDSAPPQDAGRDADAGRVEPVEQARSGTEPVPVLDAGASGTGEDAPARETAAPAPGSAQEVPAGSAGAAHGGRA